MYHYGALLEALFRIALVLQDWLTDDASTASHY